MRKRKNPKANDIEWRTYKGIAGDLQTLLIGNYFGIEKSRLYNDFSPFQWSFKRSKRRLVKDLGSIYVPLG